MRRTNRTSLLLLAFPLMGFVCEGTHYPVLQNNLGRPVEIRAVYSDGHSFSGEFPAGARISSPREGVRLTHLEVATRDQVLFRLDADALERLRADVAPEKRVVWVIEREGVRALPPGQ
jgi:hypothetical protein